MSDNLITPVPAATVLATKDLGAGGHVPKNILVDTAGVEVIGLVTASPDANTLLGRLKAIYDKLAATIAVSVASLPLPSGAATAAAQATGNTSLAAAAAAAVASAPANSYLPVTLGPTNLAGGACRAIVAEVAGRVNLKQPDGTVRANYPLSAGVNPIGALAIDAPTSGTAATGVWALYA